tara:strand:- start:13 stop:543 length:531 start_codon:yes stop_codon:yes gene_type:complete
MSTKEFSKKFDNMRQKTGMEKKENKNNDNKNNENKNIDSSIPLNLVSTNTTILDQIPSYNKQNIDNFINTMQYELKEQETLNDILKNNNNNDNIKKIESFITDNESVIQDQLESLFDISNKLKNTINENEVLKKKENHYKSLLESEKCTEIANKMRKIKKYKSDLIFFLQEKGVNL